MHGCGVTAIPRDAQGNYTLPAGTLVAAGDTVLVEQHNPAMTDIGQALTQSLPRDGRGGMLGPLNMNNFPIIGLPGTFNPVNLVGLFVNLSGAIIDPNAVIIQTSGYSAPGKGAAWYVYDAVVNTAYVAAHPATSFIDGGGRGFRLDLSQLLRWEMLGGGGGATITPSANNTYTLTNTPTDNWPAWLALKALTLSLNTRKIVPRVWVGDDNYYFSQLPEFHEVIHWEGNAPIGPEDAGYPIGSSILWPSNQRGLLFGGNNTSGQDATGSNLGDSRGSIWRGINLVGVGPKGDQTCHAMQMRTPVEFLGRVYGCSGLGGRIVAYTDGTPNQPFGECNSFTLDLYVHDAAGHGLLIQGSDVNAARDIKFTCAQAGGAALVNRSYFANRFSIGNIANYGNTGVFYNGYAWQLNQDTGYAGALTAAPGTPGAPWLLLGALAGPNSIFPAYSPTTTYRLQTAIFDSGSGSVYEAAYVESGSIFSIVYPPSVVIAGTLSTDNNSPHLLADGSGNSNGALVNTTGMGGVAKFVQGDPNFTKYGQYLADVLVGNPGTPGAKVARQYGCTVSGGNVVEDYTNNGDRLASRSADIEWLSPGIDGGAYTSGPSRMGRTVRQRDVRAFPRVAIGGGTYTAEHRMQWYGGAAPTSGDFSDGEFIWNYSPRAGGTLGWSCIQAGAIAPSGSAWAANTFYPAGTIVTNGGNTYVLSNRGTSSSSGSGPSGTTAGAPIQDGGCIWYYAAQPFVFKAIPIPS